MSVLNNDVGNCPKCGSYSISKPFYRTPRKGLEEYLEYTCQRCRFKIMHKTLDQLKGDENRD